MNDSRRTRSWPRRLAWTLVAVLGIGAVGLVGGGLWVRGRVLASLPVLDGELQLPGLGAAVRVERDALGVPTIHASGREDAARALGFLHAQERFFQMDLLRRQGAGELSELIGSATLAADRRMRVHRFRASARANVEALDATTRGMLDAYAAGVNAGLAALGEKPPEYLALRAEPASWRPEDSILILLTMYDTLQSDNPPREKARALVHELYPPEMARFLVPAGTEWDAPLDGEGLTVPDIPGLEILDLRQAPKTVREAARSRSLPGSPEPLAAGSNNWAVDGARTADGGALVANDMHLPLSLPNTWYRAVWTWLENGATRRWAGVTLPGAPTLIAGSNGDIAWGFTNSQGDWADLVIVEPHPQDPASYLTPDGPRPFVVHRETIAVHGGTAETLEVRETIWGPVIEDDHRGRPLALQWVAHDVPLGDIGNGMERARSLEEAVEAANRSGIPTQNVVLADRGGRIGWTLMGPMPQRVGCAGDVPHSRTDGTCRWDGRVASANYPRIVGPPEGILWTANNRTVGGEWLARMGDGGYDTGARAGQIRDGLRPLHEATPRDMLAIQLDDRALFLARWRVLLLETLDDAALAANPRREPVARAARDEWSGHASVDSVGYRVVRGFRQFLADQVFEALTARCREVDEDFDYRWLGQTEGPLWKLVTERPPHLLAPKHASWRDQLLAAVDATVAYYAESGGIVGRTWGERNTVRLRHPLSLAVPQLGRWIDAPAVQLPGDSGMPRVQAPGFGASERFAVSPGREEAGLFHMPGGQSGHPFSPHYLAGNDAWARGEATPFLPGPTEHTLTLVP